MSARREDDDIQDLVRGPNRIFSGPNSRVRTAYEPSEVEEIELVQDAYIAYLQDRIAKLDENQPIVLKIKLLPPTKVEFNFLGRTMVPKHPSPTIIIWECQVIVNLQRLETPITRGYAGKFVDLMSLA